MSELFYPYRFESLYTPLLTLLGARPGRDGVTATDRTLRATFGRLTLETARGNVAGAHLTERYRWYKAIGTRLSAADDGLTFGTNTSAACASTSTNEYHECPEITPTRRSPSLSPTASVCYERSIRHAATNEAEPQSRALEGRIGVVVCEQSRACRPPSGHLKRCYSYA